MNTITLAGRDYKVTARFGHLKKLAKKYPDAAAIMSNINDYVADAVWMLLPRRVFKPFVTKNRMMNMLTFPEVKRLQETVPLIMIGRTDAEISAALNKVDQVIAETPNPLPLRSA